MAVLVPVGLSAPPEPPPAPDVEEIDSILQELDQSESLDKARDQFEKAQELGELQRQEALDALDELDAIDEPGALDELYFEGKKFVEIRIDDDGIRATDVDGNEYVFQPPQDELDYDPPYDAPQPGSGKPPVVEFGDVYIAYDDEVDGDVVCVGGNVTVDGVVDGTIFSTGSVTLGPNAIVTGDVVAKRIQKDPGAEVQGRFKKFDPKYFPFPSGGDIGLPGLFAWFMVALYIVVFSFLVMVIFRRPVERIKYQIERGAAKNLLVGFLLVLGIGPFFVLLCITIVGIPVAVLIYPFAIVGATILGTVGTAHYIGQRLGKTSGSLRFTSRFMTMIMGVIAFMLLWLISGFFQVTGAEVASGIFFGFGTAVVAAVLCIGYGAIWFSRFGTRPKDIGNCAGSSDSTRNGGLGGDETVSPDAVQEN
ncbi:MAG: polymer-forming cytoskeletal protein [Candidatus Zixiibacteriota bacterium]